MLKVDALERALTASALVVRLEEKVVLALDLLTKIDALHDSMAASAARLQTRVDELEARHTALDRIERHAIGSAQLTTKLH